MFDPQQMLIFMEICKAHITPEEIYESAYHDVEQMVQLVHSKVKDLTNDKFANLNHLSQENLYRRVSLMMSFYLEQNVISTASLDLVVDVQRQFRFIENIENLGWLHPKKPSDHQVTIVRYHAWLNIVSKHTKMLCPTLDIDLAWHTHLDIKSQVSLRANGQKRPVHPTFAKSECLGNVGPAYSFGGCPFTVTHGYGSIPRGTRASGPAIAAGVIGGGMGFGVMGAGGCAGAGFGGAGGCGC